MKKDKQKSQKGFTLIELLVVISIIGLVSTIATTSLLAARRSCRDTARKATLKQLQTALELYFEDNGSYPVRIGYRTSEPDVGDCAGGQIYDENWIPGLAPDYVSQLPRDPAGGKLVQCGPGNCGEYMYISNGTDYKLMSHCAREVPPSTFESFIDPRRDGGPDVCLIDGLSNWAWSAHSGGCSPW